MKRIKHSQYEKLLEDREKRKDETSFGCCVNCGCYGQLNVKHGICEACLNEVDLEDLVDEIVDDEDLC